MTRTELLTRALAVIQNSTAFWELATTWLDDGFRKIEEKGDWDFLQKETTYACEATVDEIAFSAAKFPAAAITDYSKEMKVYRPSFGELKLIETRKKFNDARGTADEGIPTHYFVGTGTGGKSLFLFPVFTAGDDATTLTLTYCGRIIFLTLDSQDLETVAGIVPKIQGALIHYVRARLWQHKDDDRQITEMAKWEKELDEAFIEENTGTTGISQGGG
jgi:hypothetical protein